MEAVPKLPLISFELKVSPENTHFGPKLKQYIAEAYREDPDSYSNEIHQLEGFRSAAVRPSNDAAGLKALIRYFCQLRAMQSRFPMAKGQPAACNFSWKDLYANMSCSLADIRFEMACILYNIGALHTQLGASEPRNNPDSLKSACTHYQNAAWAFQYLREHYPQPPGVDVSTEIMRLLQEICFAQAQECILDKSIQDTRKPTVIGAVASQVLSFYKNSVAILGPSTGTDNIHEIIGTKLYNYWYRYLSFKKSYLGCIVCLYQGMNAEEQQKMGERVAFYQQAVDKLAEARKLAKYVEPTQVTQEALTFTNDVVEGKRKAAKNENEFIYHEEVPDKDLLTDLKPVCLVKALPINFNDPEVSGQDVFSRLIPMGAHEASSLYSEEKAKLLRRIVEQAEAKNTELTEFMSSLQLEQLDILDEEEKIPQEIVDRCAAMNAKTEVIQSLVDSMNNLAEIISDVEHTLADIKSLIQEEGAKEKEHQKLTGPRPPSLVQTELARELHKYEEAHARTRDSNHVLHKAVALHVANLRLLAQPLSALRQRIPSVADIEGLDRDTMREMRRVVDKARHMQTQRDSLIQELRTAITNDDITARLLSSSESREDIFKQEIEKHMPKVKIIEQNLTAQENIINKLTSLYASYGESRRLLSDVLRKREGLINALITSYDSYGELVGKCQKGAEFYRKLAASAAQLQARVRSACHVQADERRLTAAPAPCAATSTASSAAPVVSTAAVQAKISDVTSSTASEPVTHTPKLKDYLPYMKNRALGRSITPQVQVDPLPSDSYYPETIYPTSVRPAPVGSEATDVTQMKLPDGVVMPPNMQSIPNPYNRYATPYSHGEIDPYTAQLNYAHPATSKAFDKPDDGSVYGYSAPYTPPQYSTQISAMTNPQYNPYYTSTQDNATIVTDSQNVQYNSNISQMNVMPNTSQYNAYSDPYRANQMGHVAPIPDAVSSMSAYSVSSQTELNTNFAQMHVSVSKSETKFEPNVNYGDYSQTYFSMQYPSQVLAPMATYSHAAQNTNTNIVPSQIPSDYNSLNYPYTSDSGSQYIQPNPNVTTYNMDQYNYATTSTLEAMSQGYPMYTNADSGSTYTMTSTENVATSIPEQYNLQNETDKTVNPTVLAELDAIDKPIKSFVRGEALSSNTNYPNYQNYDPNAVANYNPTEQNYQPTSMYQYTDQSNVNYAQTYQNHPGYTYNSALDNYEYSYGSQNSYRAYDTTGQVNVDPNAMTKDPNWSTQGVYTNAGICETVQSPSENVPMVPPTPVEQSNNQPTNQCYYNSPYGYQTTLQSNETTTTQAVSTNYNTNMNQSTYMQSGQIQDTNVTYSSNQVSTPMENTIEYPNANQSSDINDQNKEAIETKQDNSQNKSVEIENVDQKTEPSALDLLSDIDFTVVQKPLMPEIKVPQVSESVIKKPLLVPKTEPVSKPPPKEEVIERPAKKDIFTDPSLLNKFTKEVKDLQKLVDSLTNKTVSGLTLLDSKWKIFQDVQTKENTNRSKSIAMEHSEGIIVTEVVPFDDSRVKLRSEPDAYINASYYKQLAPWCIPLVISNTPLEKEHGVFWKAVLEYKISCILCLLSEIEIQGNFYWPTALGQTLDFSGVKVTLDEVKCTVHWTERKLTVTSGKIVHKVTHYQINVFPAKIVCSPLVLLADSVLSQTFDGRDGSHLSGAWVQCGGGAGRSAVLALLLMVVSQVRAGQIQLCDMLDEGCINLCKHRTNVLEDTKYLADAYRTALFYVQGVLCSGTTMFSGEAVSATSILPPVAPTPAASASTSAKQKFTRESFEEMKQSGLKTGDMKDPLNFLDPLWSLKKK